MEDPSYIPLRQKFLLKEGMKSFTCYLVLDILTAGGSPDNNTNVYSLDPIPSFVRLNAVTVEQLIARVITTVCFSISIYCVMQVMHSIAALRAVASGQGLATVVRSTEPRIHPPAVLEVSKFPLARGFLL